MSAHLQLIQLMCYTCGQNIAVHEKKKKRNTSTPTIIVSNASHMINGVRLSKDLQLGDNTQFHPKYLNWALTEKGNIGIEVVEVGTGRKSLSNKTGIKNWFVYFDNFCILECFFSITIFFIIAFIASFSFKLTDFLVSVIFNRNFCHCFRVERRGLLRKMWFNLNTKDILSFFQTRGQLWRLWNEHTSNNDGFHDLTWNIALGLVKGNFVNWHCSPPQENYHTVPCWHLRWTWWLE